MKLNNEISKARYRAMQELLGAECPHIKAHVLYHKLILTYYWKAELCLFCVKDKIEFLQEIKFSSDGVAYDENFCLSYEDYACHWMGANALELPFSEHITSEVAEILAREYDCYTVPNKYLPKGSHCYVRSLWKKG